MKNRCCIIRWACVEYNGYIQIQKDIDFLISEESKMAVGEIMTELGYEIQDFSTDEILSYLSPLKVFGQVDFLLA